MHQSAPVPSYLHQSAAFRQNYPAIDPATLPGISLGERIALAVSTAVLIFGAAIGNLIVAGVGVALVVFATVVANGRMDRKLRREARVRYPQEGWAEADSELNHPLRQWVLPGVWLLGVVLSALVLFLVPEGFAMTGAAVAAGVTGVLLWFTLGITNSAPGQDEEGEEGEVQDGAGEQPRWPGGGGGGAHARGAQESPAEQTGVI